MNKKKKLKLKKTKKPVDKEQAFIKYGTTILMIAVIVFAVVMSVIRIKNNFSLDNLGNYSNALTALTVEVDTNKIITNQLSDEGKAELITKLTNSGLDILTDNEVEYDKYSQKNIAITGNLSLTDQEVGLLYSYLFVNHMGEYDAILYQISISSNDEGYVINTVASVDFNKLFTSKLSKETIDSTLPKRVYVINSATYSNGNFSYSQTLFNNLTEEDSKGVSSAIKQVNDVDIDKYIPFRIITMLNNISLKSNTDLTFSDNNVAFNLKNQ